MAFGKHSVLRARSTSGTPCYMSPMLVDIGLTKSSNIATDWEGKNYVGLTLDWDYETREVHLLMSGYVKTEMKKWTQNSKVASRPAISKHPTKVWSQGTMHWASRWILITQQKRQDSDPKSEWGFVSGPCSRSDSSDSPQCPHTPTSSTYRGDKKMSTTNSWLIQKTRGSNPNLSNK